MQTASGSRAQRWLRSDNRARVSRLWNEIATRFEPCGEKAQSLEQRVNGGIRHTIGPHARKSDVGDHCRACLACQVHRCDRGLARLETTTPRRKGDYDNEDSQEVASTTRHNKGQDRRTEVSSTTSCRRRSKLAMLCRLRRTTDEPDSRICPNQPDATWECLAPTQIPKRKRPTSAPADVRTTSRRATQKEPKLDESAPIAFRPQAHPWITRTADGRRRIDGPAS